MFLLSIPCLGFAQSAKSDSLYLVAKAYYEARDYVRAAKVFEDVLTIDRSEFPDDYELSGMTSQWIGSCHYHMGDLVKARKYEASFYELEPVERMAYREAHNYWQLSQNATSLESAMMWAERCLDKELELLGPVHHYVYGSYCNLATMAFQSGNESDCRRYIEAAKSIIDSIPVTTSAWKASPYAIEALLENTLGSDTAIVAPLVRQAWTHLDGDISANPTIYNETLRLFIGICAQSSGHETVNGLIDKTATTLKSMDPDNFEPFISIVQTVNEYALNTGQPAIAMDLCSYAMGKFDDDSEQYASLLFEHGQLQKASGHPEVGVNDLSRALEIIKGLHPDDPTAWIDICYYLGECYDGVRDYKNASDSYETVLKVCKKEGYDAYAIYALQRMAAIATRRLDFKGALSYLDQCLKRMNKMKEFITPSDYAFIYKEIGVCHQGLGEIDVAADYFKKAVTVLEDNDPRTYLYIETYLKIVSIYYASDREGMEKVLDNLYDICPPDNLLSVQQRLWILKCHADCLANVGEYGRALELIDEGLNLTSSMTGYDASDLQNTKCSLYILLNKPDLAWKLADEYREDSREEYGKYSQQYMNALIQYNIIVDLSADFEKLSYLEQHGEEIIEIADSIFSKSDPLLFYYHICGAKALMFGDPGRSIDIIETALAETDPVIIDCSGTILTSAYSILCYLQRNSGNIDKSLHYADLLLDCIDKCESNQGKLATYDEIGQTMAAANRLSDAEHAYLKAVEIGETINDGSTMYLILAYQHIAELYRQMGQYDQASAYDVKMSRLSMRNYDNIPLVVINYKMNTLWLRYNAGEKRQCFEDISAIEEFVDSQDYFQKSLPFRLKALYYLYEKDHDLATENIESALEISRDIANLDAAYKIYYDKGEYDRSMQLALELLEKTRDFYGDSPKEIVGPNRYLGDTFLAKNDLDKSYTHYRKAFDAESKYINDNLLTLTSAQRADFWNSNNEFFRTYLPYVAYCNRYPCQMNGLLYDAALFSNGLLLTADQSISKIVGASSENARSIYCSLLSKRSILRKATEQDPNQSSNPAAIDSLQKECSNLERALMAALKADHPDLLTYRSYEWKDIQKSLPRNSAAIEYVDFAIDSLNCAGMALVLKKGMEQPEMRIVYRRKADDDLRSSDLYESTALGDSLITSLEDLLLDCNDVYFSPQGPLCSIALESLPRSKSRIASDIKLHRVSSTRILAESKRKKRGNSATLFGGLNYDTSVDSLVADAASYPELRDRSFVSDNTFRSSASREGSVTIPPLPGTLVEVESIAGLLKRMKKISPVSKTGSNGTESAFKAMSGCYGTILHISTHGFFNENTDNNMLPSNSFTFEDNVLEQSGLLLAGASNRYADEATIPDNVDDGILKASEIARLDLSGVEIAVLSACETGLGRVTGDGVFGLQRGFKKAGAGCILMSLWKVNDDATCALMTAFYTNWLGGQSKFDALESAKATVRSNPKWSNPDYWAAFILLDAMD